MADDDSRRFLRAIFGGAIGEQVDEDRCLRALLWCAPAKRSFWSTKVEALAAQARKWTRETQNVYFGVGLTADPPRSGRGKADDIDAINCVCADVDYGKNAGPGKRIYCPDETAAMDFLQSVVQPSLITHSGHGLQAFWVLKEPIIFLTDDDRQEAASLSRGWFEYLSAEAASRGFALDPVHDLTRVMRLPGTMNVKDPDNPVPARLLLPEHGDLQHTYTASDLRSASPAHRGRPPRKIDPSTIAFAAPTSDAVPKVVGILCENSRQFCRTWRGQRDGRTSGGKPWSASEYDLSIAAHLVQVGCPDQEIAQAIYAFRCKQGWEPRKALRPEYLALTIARAREGNETNTRRNQIEKIVADMVGEAEAPAETTAETTAEAPRETLGETSVGTPADQQQPDATVADNPPAGEEPGSSPDPTPPKAAPPGKALERLRTIFGLPIIEIIKHGRENARYSLVLEGGREVSLGSSAQLLEQRHLRSRVLEAADQVIPRMKGDVYDSVVQTMVSLARYVELVEGERKIEAEDWLHSYFLERSVYDGGDQLEQALITYSAFRMNGHAYVNASSFARYIRSQTGENHPTKRETQDMLRILGYAEGSSFDVRIEGQHVHRRYWRGPVPLIDATSQPAPQLSGCGAVIDPEDADGL